MLTFIQTLNRTVTTNGCIIWCQLLIQICCHISFCTILPVGFILINSDLFLAIAHGYIQIYHIHRIDFQEICDADID